MTTKLIVYNDVLRELGTHPLANLTSANTRLQELDGAFTNAVSYIMSRVDWDFASRRTTLSGTADTSYTPYTKRYTPPSDYLRKCWLKKAATDEFQTDHIQTGAVFYGYESSVVLEYISNTSDNYDPANWPPQFTRCVTLYLAMLVAPKLARSGEEDTKAWYQKLDIAIQDAERQEAVFNSASQVASNRLPTIRRAIELMGQTMAGSFAINSRLDEIRWSMNKAWDDAVTFMLHQGAWNFAAKRALYQNGTSGDASIPTDSIAGIDEGYTVAPDSSSATIPSVSGFDYGFPLPDDFLHKIWIKSDVANDMECAHQQLGAYMFTNQDPCVMEYVAASEFATTPTNWPHPFREALAAYLALAVAPELIIEDGGRKAAIKAPQLREKLEMAFNRKLSDARLKDAIQQDVKRIPIGNFARSRMGWIGTSLGRRYN